MEVIFKLIRALTLLCLQAYTYTSTLSTANETLLNFIAETDSLFCDTCMGHQSDASLTRKHTELLPVSPPDEPSSLCCERCSCRAECHLYENCCPGQTGLFPVKEERFHCIYQQLKPYHDHLYPNTDRSRVRHGCPDNYSLDNRVRDKCENVSDYDTLDVFLPVTDRETKITYRNRYCAHCNNIEDERLEYWTPEVLCSNASFLITDSRTVISDVLKTNTCNLVYKMPDSLYDNPPHCSFVISECNVTGLWEVYDPLIEQACATYRHVYKNIYRNVFCYMCNTNMTTVDEDECYPNPGFGGGVITFVETSFSIIIKFTPPSPPLVLNPVGILKAGRCRHGQIYDGIQNVCRDIVCYPSRVYTDGTCVSTIQSIGGMSYQVFIKLTLVKDSRKTNTIMVAQYLKNHFKNMMLELLTRTTHFHGHVFRRMSAESDDQAEESTSFIIHVDISVSPYFKINSSAIDAILALDNEILEINCFENIYAKYQMALVKPISTLTKLVLSENEKNDTYVEALSFVHNGYPLMTPTFTETLIPPIGCPLIGLPFSECQTEMNNRSVTVQWLQVTLSRSEYLKTNETVYICKSLFLHAISDLQQILLDRKFGNTSLEFRHIVGKAQHFLSLICSSLSVFCSLLTLLTYSLFKDLRTQPGINNMMLTGSLIFAQVLFQFGSNLANEIPDWVCKLIGILIHLSWLLTLAWMNVCSLHMFKVFRNYKTMPHRGNILRTTLTYTCYCIAVSVLPVVVNISVSAVWTHSRDIGYGGHICYISDHRMVGFTFALPVGILIIANFVLFAAVLITLKGLNHIEHAPKHRNFIHIYLKLSTLCGFTWTFGFLYVVTGEEALEYIFIVSNASQGVFIFLSFVCNRRVLLLYRDLLTRRRGAKISAHPPAAGANLRWTFNTRF